MLSLVVLIKIKITLLGSISDSLWRRIEEIQKKGGSNHIVNQLNMVDKSADDISKRVSELDSKIMVS